METHKVGQLVKIDAFDIIDLNLFGGDSEGFIEGKWYKIRNQGDLWLIAEILEEADEQQDREDGCCECQDCGHRFGPYDIRCPTCGSGCVSASHE